MVDMLAVVNDQLQELFVNIEAAIFNFEHQVNIFKLLNLKINVHFPYFGILCCATIL